MSAIDRERQFVLKPRTKTSKGRRGVVFAALASTALVTGCVAGPTYGTGTPAGEQLLSDMTGLLAIGPSDRAQVEYNPRGELVTPPSTAVLPTPQAPVVQNSSAWPESPEQRLARIRDDATANQNNPFFQPVASGTSRRAPSGPPLIGRANEQPEASANNLSREEVNRRLAERRQETTQTGRRYLSEPPVEYRQAAETAPVGDIGEDEWRKQRRLEQAAGGGRSWRDFVPFL
jgi:hypothetical protein